MLVLFGRIIAVYSMPLKRLCWPYCSHIVHELYPMSGDGPVLCKSQNPRDSCHGIESKPFWSYLFFLVLAVDFQVLTRAVVVLL